MIWYHNVTTADTVSKIWDELNPTDTERRHPPIPLENVLGYGRIEKMTLKMIGEEMSSPWRRLCLDA